MKRFEIIAVMVAIFLQAKGQSINSTELEVGNFIGKELQQKFVCQHRLGAEKAIQLPSETQGMEQLPENNSVLNEYFDCLWKEKEIISENAVLNEDKLEEYFIDVFPLYRITGPRGREAAHDAVQKCKNVLGNDSGQRAVKIQNCITKCIKENTT